MDALVKFEECTDYITVTNGGTEHRVKVVGTTDKPYFCGKDVCEVLGHKDVKRTLYCQVDAEYRVSLKEIQQNTDKGVVELGSTTSIGQNNLINLTYHKLKEVGALGAPTSIGQNNLTNLTYHTGRAVYHATRGGNKLCSHLHRVK